MTGSWKRDSGNPVSRWLFLTGHRLVVAVFLAAIFAALAALLIALDLIYVGPGSNLSTALSSGLLSGLLTLLTVVLTINQLILSRVFGSAGGLMDQLEDTLEFRRTVEELSDVPASPNKPTAFLGLLADTLDRRVEEFRGAADAAAIDVDPGDDVSSYVSDITDYADHLATADDVDDPFKALIVTLGTDYSDHIDSTRKLQAKYGEALPDEAAEALDDVLELLKAVATMRQFYKTLTLQQELAMLSRRLIYTGVPAILVAYFLSATWTAASDMSTAIDPALMPLVVTVATGIVLLPLAVLLASLVRVATVSLYTVSIGTFIPPEKTYDGE